MRRQGNVDALGSGRIVIPGDGVNPLFGIEVRAQKPAFGQKSARHLSPTRSAALWLTAAFVAATWTPDVQAHDIGRSGDASARLAQTSTSDPQGSQAAEGQEHQKAEMLARELATAQRDLEVLLRLLNRACDESNSAKQAADRETAELRKALQEERDRADRMGRDLAAMRRGVEPQGALTTMTGDEVTPPKQVADAGLTDLQKSLQQERDRADRMGRDLAAMRRDVETQTALVAKAGAEASQFKKTAEAGLAELRKSLQQEHERASRLEQDLVAARRDVETQTALVAKAGAEASQFKKTAEAGLAELRKSLQQEHERASQLEQDLVAARRDVETQTALVAKAGAEVAQLKQAAEKGSAELKQSLQQEQDKAERLAEELATAHARIYAFEAQARQASDQAAELKQAAEGGVADLRTSLQQERDRASRLEQDVAAARRDVEKQTALAAKASDEAGKLRQAAESGSAELRKSLQQEHDRAAQLERDLERVQSENSAPAPSITTVGQTMQDRQREAEATKPIAAEQAAVAAAPADVQPHPKDAAEVARLVARASVILGQGDIGSARIVLERAAETGDAQASFSLAETYDPLILPKWGTYGTRGDAARARDLYAKAEAGGIKEAKERVDALRR
jgi:septal ring factor EnvC (AmiA/AmiB activator)